ncbi:hypothetical protein [Nocardiopsis trehalosi]|uniref:hypothetical protein n=1 Tax=Nocardiopsis trehalosi TaxID=109329 RepID=UPI000836CFE0|nr:hypothetical protein [Nocardiopsis trehalosi]
MRYALLLAAAAIAALPAATAHAAVAVPDPTATTSRAASATGSTDTGPRVAPATDPTGTAPHVASATGTAAPRAAHSAHPADTAQAADATHPADTVRAVVGPGDDRVFAFGDTAAIAYPVGAYPAEFDWDRPREVGFRVDTVERSGPGHVRYRLTVDVPELGRVLGLGGIDPRCSAASGPPGGPGELPSPGELESGRHTFRLTCPLPADTADLGIHLSPRDARGDTVPLVFTGPAPS